MSVRTIRPKAYRVYSLQHLKRYYPEGYKKAFEKYQDNCDRYGDIPRQDETIDSLKALFMACSGVTLKDWNLGAYNRGNFLRCEFSQDGAEDLSGPRAMAWLENNLLSGLRIKAWPLCDKMDGQTYKNRNSRYWIVGDSKGRRGHAGEIPDCPLTGYCMDDDLIDSLRKDTKDGDTLRCAFEHLADVVRRILEQESDYQRSEECFREQNADQEYTKEGEGI
jgi:hypothetical protein